MSAIAMAATWSQQPCGTLLRAEDGTVRRRWRREVKASFVSHTLAGFGRTEHPARCGNIGVVPPLFAAKTKLLAAGEDDPGLQIYRYSDKPELRGALRGELGPLPETKPSSCHGSSEKSPSELKPPAAEQPHG